jgi:hypothetical protein
MEYNDRSGIFSINSFYIDKSKNKYDFTEEEIKGFLRDLAEGLDYCKLDIYVSTFQ